MLTQCPECNLQVSDKASICPHCGYPFKTTGKKIYHNGKPRRLPNGFGQITKITSKNLRKPYRVMVTVGRKANGRPNSVLLKPTAYFETYNEAYKALVEYNKNPYDLVTNITMDELFKVWLKNYEKNQKLALASIQNKQTAWNYCSSIYNMPVREVRVRHLRQCIENGTYEYRGEVRTPSVKVQERMKMVFNMLFDYAVENELTDRNYARGFKLNLNREDTEVKKPHNVFTPEEMNTLWKNVKNIPYVDVILFQCYTGWRPQELGLLKLSDVNLNEWSIVGGIKTESSKNRIVPVHSKIQSIVKDLYNRAQSLNSEYLINYPETNRAELKMTYHRYYQRFNDIMAVLEMDPEHRPHDPRKHFVTMAKKYNLDEYAIKRIVGHHIDDITESVYTDRSIEWLRAEIEKIKE